MKNKTLEENEVKIKLVKSMLSHVPFDGWTWLAMEQGSIDNNFKKNMNKNDRLEIFKAFFKNGSIDFIELFTEIVDKTIEKNYESLISKPQKVPEKVKKIILMRLAFCLPYRESVRLSLSTTALPKNSKKSIQILYKTCNSIWRLAGDKSTDFSFYTKRLSLGAVYTSTLLFWLNDTSDKQQETEYFLDRRLKDVSKISYIKKPLNILQNITDNNKIRIKSIFGVIKRINKVKNSMFR